MKQILGYDGSYNHYKHDIRVAARAHFINAFSMLNIVGTKPGIDFDVNIPTIMNPSLLIIDIKEQLHSHYSVAASLQSFIPNDMPLKIQYMNRGIKLSWRILVQFDNVSCRLDILALLLAHNLKRYQTSSPPVKYVEFSLGINDASRLWVMRLLSQFNRFISRQWTDILRKWIPGRT